MFVECYKNNGVDYLRLVRSVRRPKKSDPSVYTSYKETELNIGPLSRFDDGKPDYVQRLKQSFRDGKPLIPALQPYVNEPAVPQHEGIPNGASLFKSSFAHPRYASQLLLDRIFQELGLSELFNTIKFNSKIEYPLVDYVRLLIFDRILNPASKIGTVRHNEDYCKPIVTDDDYAFHVYDALNVIYENRDKILKRMNSTIASHTGRDTSLLFYDVTNFYFEIGDPDSDVTDDDGNVLAKGIRKKGVCKEERSLPIVQMPMFLDNSGLPIAIDMFPGNTLDAQTAVPAYEHTIRKLGFKSRFIFIADRGICTGPIMCELLDGGNGYIISKPIRKADKNLKNWILDKDGYNCVSDNFRYKSKIITASVRDKDGNQRTVQQKAVAYWSRNFYERDTKEHKSFLEFVEKLKESPANFRVTRAQAASLRKFMSRDVLNKETGEVLDSEKLIAMIDEKKLEEYTSLMGYYVIVTSELGMDSTDVIDKYHGLSRIENQFEEMKGTLDTRPMYVHKSEHIYAHLLICMIALVMIRLIQRKYKQKYPPAKDDRRNWTYGLTGERVQTALQKWKAIQVGEDSYWFADVDDEDLSAILAAYNLVIPQKQYSYGEMTRMKRKIDVYGRADS